MSHFTVLVIGEDPESQLAPYHEYECTGIDDQYVQDIDITEEARSSYEEATTRQLVAPDGTVYDRYDVRFYRELTAEEASIRPFGPNGSCCQDWGDGKGYRPKMHFVPEGYVERSVPRSHVETFEKFVEGYYGHTMTDGKVIRHTNPNAKWDWYVLGGRWDGFFITRGEKTNQARKCDIDFDAMRAEKVAHAGVLWDEFHSVAAGRPIPNWAKIREVHGDDIQAARDEYDSHTVVRDLRKADFWDNISEFDCPREQFCARRAAFRTFAVIKDSQWYEKGSMGWWGCVADEKDPDTWLSEFAKLLQGLPDDTLLSVYDCHI